MQTQQCDRTGWAKGPWDQEPDQVEWMYRGLKCLASRGNFGFWCGYVAVPREHPYYGLSWEVLRDAIEVHGGLNADGPGDPDRWWFGFSCSQAFDVSPGLDAFLKRLDVQYTVMGTYRDLDFVKAEVQALADQLHDVG